MGNCQTRNCRSSPATKLLGAWKKLAAASKRGNAEIVSAFPGWGGRAENAAFACLNVRIYASARGSQVIRWTVVTPNTRLQMLDFAFACLRAMKTPMPRRCFVQV